MMKRPLPAMALAAVLVGLTACGGYYGNQLAGSYNTSLKRGSEALRAKDFETAAEAYAFAASSGHPKALISYGKLFARGQGVEKDAVRARDLYLEAHGKNSSFKNAAAYELGQVYLKGGEGPNGALEMNELRARGFLVEALEGGEQRAASSLGRIYERGLGVPADVEMAISYYRQAPERDAIAARNLALLLAKTGANEQQVANAAAQAVSQFEIRAQSGDVGSTVQLAEIYSRDEIIAVDAERTLGYLKTVGETDDPAMQVRLARIYGRIGENEERNRMLRLAADAGDVKAQTELARLFLRPRSDDANGTVGRYYAERAISQGNEDAMLYLGSAMLRGEVVDLEPALGETLLRRASDGGHVRASAVLGAAILKGDIPERTLGEAIALLEWSAGEGSGEAMSALGFGYRDGRGLPQDEALALEWLEKAAKAGSKRAKAYLDDRADA